MDDSPNHKRHITMRAGSSELAMKLKILKTGIGSLFITLISFMLLTQQARAEDPGEMFKLDFETTKAWKERKGEIKDFFTPLYTFANVSINYLDWTDGTEERSGKADFPYLELEGGAGWSWGEFYFFTDLENPHKSWTADPPDNMRFVIKPILDVKLAQSNFYFHVQDYFLKEDTFYVNNLVPGLAYKFTTDYGFWIRPFIGPHYQSSTFYSGWNGWMGGWVFAYDFNIKGQKLTLSQWHEFEWDRDEEHYQLDDGTPVGDGRSHGINGAVALWWHPHEKITAGLQYRYADYKLGSATYQAGPIFTLKYNF